MVCLVSDIHGNLPALQSVISAVGECEEWWNAGDVVGYGPFPNECVSLSRDLKMKCVAGNHDLASIGKIQLHDFNEIARYACDWTCVRLDAESKEYLSNLPLIREITHQIGLYHGSYRDPVWEYIVHPSQALRNFRECCFSVSFTGHSHVPMIFALSRNDELSVVVPDDGFEITLEEKVRYIVNVGSVGQPRDGDPRACFAMLDMETGVLKFRRVEYSIEKVQRKIVEVGLPEFLAIRLSFGR